MSKTVAELELLEKVDTLSKTFHDVHAKIREEVPTKEEFNNQLAETSQLKEQVEKMAKDIQTQHNDMVEALKEVNTASLKSEEFYEERTLLGASVFYDALFTNKGNGGFADVDVNSEKFMSNKVTKAMDKFWKEEVKRFEKRKGIFATVIDTGTSGSAAEWMGTQYLSMVKEEIRHPLSVIDGMINKVVVQGHNIFQPTKTASMYESGANHWLNAGVQSVAEKSAPTAHSTLTSGGSTRSLAKAMGTTTYSYESVSDSFVDMAGQIARDLVFSLEQAKEYAVINGATTIADVFTGGNASTASLINAWDGFIASALGGNGEVNAGGNALTLDDLRGMYAPLGAAGLSPTMCSFLTEAYGMVQMLNLDEVLTIDKYGLDATVRRGEISIVDGRKVFISDHLHRALADGTYDTATASNNVLSSILLIKEPVWTMYVKEGILLEEDRNITTQIVTKAISERLLLVKDNINEEAAGIVRNIA